MLTVLIVEDEAIIAEDIRKTLERLECDVLPAVRTGEDAVKRCARVRPDPVLMDIRLQGEMDGFKAGERITRRFGIPIVYVSANAEFRPGEMTAGTDPVRLPGKPIDPNALIDLVNEFRSILGG
jgi:CheY-like chemotaxis protein